MLKRVKSSRLPWFLRVLPVGGLAMGVISLVSLHSLAASPSPQPVQKSPAGNAKLVRSYGKLPLSFEANEGQVDSVVHFLARGSGYGLYLTGQEAVLTLRKPLRGPTSRPLSGKSLSQRMNANGISPDAVNESLPDGNRPMLPPQIATPGRQFTTDVLRMQ